MITAAKMTKDDFKALTGKTVTFQIVNEKAEFRVKLVDHNEDMTFTSTHVGSSVETIKVKIVDYFPDIRLKQVPDDGQIKLLIRGNLKF
jgi:hypothetical protein